MAKPLTKARGKVLGIIAGRGELPVHVARAAQAAGRPVHIVAIKGLAGEDVAKFPHSWANIGQLGHFLDALKRARCDELVIIGGASRPQLRDVRFDLGTFIHLPSLLALMIGGDDRLLSLVVRFFERKGFKVIGADAIAPDLLAAVGPLGKHRPRKQDQADIEVGFAVAKALGVHDVGQAVVVARGHVLAVEAAEGTDAMLARCGSLKKWGLRRGGPKVGVLVKRAKPGQERRVDLPSIGPETVRRASAARLSGIAVAAGDVLIAECEAAIRLADQNGLFIVGVASKPRSPARAKPKAKRT